MPFTFIKPLWAHQLATFERAKDEPDFAPFYEQGCGKTPLQINILRYKYTLNRRVLKTLILAPFAVVRGWRREFEAHSKVSHLVTTLGGSEKQRLKALEATKASGKHIIVTNYEALTMPALAMEFVRFGFEILVCDECHRLKNRSAKRTKAALAIRWQPAMKHCYMLSGTPILNQGAMDIFSQYQILDKGRTFGDNFFIFRARYFRDKNSAWASKPGYFPKWIPRPEMEGELSRRIYRKADRVMKKDCLDLPPFVRERRDVGLGTEQAKHYAEMKRDYITFVERHLASGESLACVAQLAITHSMRLRQIVTGFMKMENGEVVRFPDTPRKQELHTLLSELTPYHKVIVWACFIENYETIREVCAELGVKCVEYRGGLTEKARREAEDAFLADPAARVMCANPASAGEGLNLQIAAYSLYYSRSVSMKDDVQSEARNYRAGSEIHKSVTRIDLVASDTIDETVLEALEGHKSVAEAILAYGKKDVDSWKPNSY
jgi:SNF2 family DNA or RNA helicase